MLKKTYQRNCVQAVEGLSNGEGNGNYAGTMLNTAQSVVNL